MHDRAAPGSEHDGRIADSHPGACQVEDDEAAAEPCAARHVDEPHDRCGDGPCALWYRSASMSILQDRTAIAIDLKGVSPHRLWTEISFAGRGPRVQARVLPIQRANL